MSEDKIVEEYLGDSVYAKFDGQGIELYVSNGITKSDPIYLEPEVIIALLRFKDRHLPNISYT